MVQPSVQQVPSVVGLTDGPPNRVVRLPSILRDMAEDARLDPSDARRVKGE